VPSLKARTVLIIGRGSGIAWAIALAVIAEGGRVIAANLAPDGSFLFMSGATALKPSPGMLAVAATNAAVDAITAGLAVELAPVRVNAIAPGTIDTGAYDALGEERKAALFRARSATNPPAASARRTRSRPWRWRS
jgi:NAD(P)-dependent dehydrogenase (short-subunit alcohol dehydrogenase family)